jgi:hypothetical protein
MTLVQTSIMTFIRIALLLTVVWIVGNSETFQAGIKAAQALDAKAAASMTVD